MRVKHVNVPSVMNQGTIQLLNNFTRPSIFTDSRCFHVQDKGVSKQGNGKYVPYCTCSSLLVDKEMAVVSLIGPKYLNSNNLCHNIMIESC